MLGSPAGPGGTAQRGFWPLAPTSLSSTTNFTSEGYSKYGIYSFLPGSPAIGSALYSHNSIGRFTTGSIQSSPGAEFHAHKDSIYASSTGYTFGAPTPPPGSPYSPVPVTQFLTAKGFNSNIIVQQQQFQQHINADHLSMSPSSNNKTASTLLKPLLPISAESTGGVIIKEHEDVNSNNGVGSNNKCCNNCSKACCSCCSSPTTKSGMKFDSDSSSGCSRTNPIDWNAVNIKKEPSTMSIINNINNNNNNININNNNNNSLNVITSNVLDSSCTNGLVKIEACCSPVLVGQQKSSSACETAQTSPPAITLPPLPPVVTSNGHLPMEPLMPMPVPMPPVGYQLVRDHTTGGLLLLPTTGVEQVQQTVLWPSYHSTSSHVMLPPSMPPPLQLLGSSDYLQQTTNTTLHHHQQHTHSSQHHTRLLTLATTDNNKKLSTIPPTTALIKIESDFDNKALQAASNFGNTTGTVYSNQNVGPLVTTHVIYQHPTNLIVTQTPTSATNAEPNPTQICNRSQATSPVECLTPPPENNSLHEEDLTNVQCVQSVQDASNQTDAQDCCSYSPVLQEQQAKELLSFKEVQITVPENDDDLQVQVDDNDEIIHHQQDKNSKDAIVVKLEQSEEKPEKQELDWTGLELLSNSVVELESKETHKQFHCLQDNEDEKNEERKNDEVVESLAQMSLVDSPVIPVMFKHDLGGLDLLCALAEQRIKEEGNLSNLTQETRRSDTDSGNFEHFGGDKNLSDEHLKSDNSIKTTCTCRAVVGSAEDSYKTLCKTYKTKESEQVVKKFLASKSQSYCCKGEWPCMNAMELDMRMRLADLQRKYREKQKELNKLKPKKCAESAITIKKCRSRKRSYNSDYISKSTPPIIDKYNDKTESLVSPTATVVQKYNKSQELLKPPTLRPYEKTVCTTTNNITSYPPVSVSPVSLPPTSVLPVSVPLVSISPGPYSDYSSKKRKVGRPKKLSSSYGSECNNTETIVAKKPKKVNYLIEAKEEAFEHDFIDDIMIDDDDYNFEPDNDEKTNDETVNDETHLEELQDDDEDEDVIKAKKSKVSPILEERQNGGHNCMETCTDDNRDEKPIVKSEKSIIDHEDNEQEESLAVDDDKDEKINNRCTLTTERLGESKLRVLTAMGGLFYAGRLNAVEPPDVYSITLDGERGNRPHIMSREEILRDAILEISPSSMDELTPGTRLCAYWSQQYRCLYPGSVSDPDSDPNSELNSKFVSVEFDDGDNGRIAIEDIRLLPPDYPIIEYDPNPLLSLCKRRRRTSTTDERRSTTTATNTIPATPDNEHPPSTAVATIIELGKENLDNNNQEIKQKSIDAAHKAAVHKERKKLKKKKRDKCCKQKSSSHRGGGAEDDEQLKRVSRKKRKKHKCPDVEGCKHRKHHKKHRKHKRHHHSKESVEKKETTSKSDSSSSRYDDEKTKIVVDDDDDDDEISSSVVQIAQSLVEQEVEEELEEKIVEEIIESEVKEDEDIPEHPVGEVVTIHDILEAKSNKKNKKFRDRQESCESRSKMSAFLPARQLWGWSGKGYKRPKAKGRSRKQFFRAIQRGKETIQIGDSAVFLSTGRPDRPYIGRIEAMWESCGTMVVRVKWFYHPEETVGRPLDLKYPGALFESPHVDENDVQTISHKCEVLPLKDYIDKLGNDPKRYATIYDNNDIYYLAGYYDPTTTTLKMELEIPINQ